MLEIKILVKIEGLNEAGRCAFCNSWCRECWQGRRGTGNTAGSGSAGR